ncbi:MAG: Type fimbrial biosis protein PilY1, partial [Myxococcaceae bacterium]|nr:Type fimbrial biosis protein PilY1 [Myxococcaceae bacterium]
MRRHKLYSLVALGLSVLTPKALAQSTGLADTLSVKPIMMLLVDTSGSMERLPDAAGSLPDCHNNSSDSSQKNRWAVTLEALTGTFNSFRCVQTARSTYVGQYDEDYFLPHYDFTGSPSQATDGVMDTYLSTVKFGLITFDGVSTTVNGATLVPWTHYNKYATFKAQIL